jgi:hypothetical protein
MVPPDPAKRSYDPRTYSVADVYLLSEDTAESEHDRAFITLPSTGLRGSDLTAALGQESPLCRRPGAQGSLAKQLQPNREHHHMSTSEVRVPPPYAEAVGRSCVRSSKGGR